jgi:hypothetical protein
VLVLAAPAAGSPVLVYDGGAVLRVEDPALPPPEAANPVPAAARECIQSSTAPVATAAAITVRRALRRAYSRGDIDREAWTTYSDIYSSAKKAWHGLGGSRRANLGSVVVSVNQLAARGLLNASRMAPVFLELQRNTEWWSRTSRAPSAPSEGGNRRRTVCTTAARIAAGPRVQFKGDPLTLQYYPGAGLRLQPLANFGKANALINACRGINTEPGTPCDLTAVRELLDRLVAMGANRAGFLAWEYYFPIYGGRPPWVSGIAEGSALSALANGAALLQEQEQQQQPPPGQPPPQPTGGTPPLPTPPPPPSGGQGTQSQQPDQAEPAPNPPSFYLDAARRSLPIYKRSPPLGIRVRGPKGPHYLIYPFNPGERVGNAFLESLIGLWDYAKVADDRTAQTLFDKGDREARHELRLLDTGAWSLYELGGAESDLNYHRVIRDFARNLCDRTQIAVYCTEAERFTAYLSQRPKVAVVGPKAARSGKLTRIAIRVSKISCLTISIFRGTRVVDQPTWYFPRGVHSFAWVPGKPGNYRVKVLARDLLNHQTTVEAPLRVLRRGKR